MEFPNTPRGRRARQLDGRCPVHGAALEVGAGFASRMDLTPSREFEAMQRAPPFCLDLGESFAAGSRQAPATPIWCAECVAAARGFARAREAGAAEFGTRHSLELVPTLLSVRRSCHAEVHTRCRAE